MMHRLLKRQLKKIGYILGSLSAEQTEKLLALVNQAYIDNDEDRMLLENTLTISSKEMQGLYEQLKLTAESELAISEAKYKHLAKYDILTGIPNRLHLEEKLKSLLSHSNRHHDTLAILFLDLDHFKNINDTLGHNIGDKLLQQLTKRIEPNIRNEDIFARIGGDEFIIVLCDIEEKNLLAVIHKIMDLIHQPWHIKNFELKTSASIGIALYPQDGITVTELIKNADIAMYRAKELGRDNFSFFTSDLNERVHTEMKLEQDMADALKDKQFELYFQPILILENDTIKGAEALIRWNHPTMGLIYPDAFITLAENTGFILKLGTWVIEEGCRAIAKFNALHSKKLTLSVNISTRQFQHGDIYHTIKNAIKSSGIDPNQFAIEITESIMMENNDTTMDKLNAIKSLGIQIYMDDFGTGYSSLFCLHRLPIDSLKIDKSFVDEITKENSKAILLETIIAMGKTLDKNVIAEGIEHEYQRQYLIEHGCHFYQGYLFSKPLKEGEYCNAILHDVNT